MLFVECKESKIEASSKSIVFASLGGFQGPLSLGIFEIFRKTGSLISVSSGSIRGGRSKIFSEVGGIVGNCWMA